MHGGIARDGHDPISPHAFYSPSRSDVACLREEEVVGAEKDETAATAAAGEASPALAPTAVPPADHRQLCSSAATGIISAFISFNKL